MGGTIQVDSAPGKGSTFRVELPVEPAQSSEVTALQGDSGRVIGLEPDQPDYRILVVDDQIENSTVLERLLQGAGFTVHVAANGAEAVALFEAWRPQFIWMDLRMPVLDGFGATGRIRALEGGKDVKIVAVTASGFESQLSEVLAAGLDDYLRKPYRPNQIFDCMARHLGVRYRYSEAEPAPTGELAAAPLPEALAALPQELRAELRDALLALNPGRIIQAIGRVSQRDAALGATLSRLADHFAYTAMLEAVESSLRGGIEIGS